ncbi:hypothetical protein NE563_21390, partial [Enterococcus avium]|nr:hypothetical protein [Enterococcus avium]
SFTEIENDWLNQFKYPKTPSFLKTWNTHEWKFFLYSIYSSQLNNFELQPKKTVDESFFTQVITHCTTNFSRQFRP